MSKASDLSTSRANGTWVVVSKIDMAPRILIFHGNHGCCVPEYASLGCRCSIWSFWGAINRNHLLDVSAFHDSSLFRLPHAIAAWFVLLETTHETCSISESPCSLDNLSFLPYSFQLVLRIRINVRSLAVSFAFFPHTRIDVLVWILEGSLAMSFAILEETMIVTSSFVVDASHARFLVLIESAFEFVLRVAIKISSGSMTNPIGVHSIILIAIRVLSLSLPIEAY
mmetsp:Transcript_96829/g.153331  ORF Transcript_96829/g.153331 Transcript_96829/m.153331 type:complete len:226 (-) Transcript_96829:153-830(-)